MPADDGDGTATVKLAASDKEVGQKMAARTMSDPSADPTTGADLGAGRTKNGDMGGTPDIASAPAMAEATVVK